MRNGERREVMLKCNVELEFCRHRMNFRLLSLPGQAKQKQTNTLTLMTSMTMKMVGWLVHEILKM